MWVVFLALVAAPQATEAPRSSVTKRPAPRHAVALWSGEPGVVHFAVEAFPAGEDEAQPSALEVTTVRVDNGDSAVARYDLPYRESSRVGVLAVEPKLGSEVDGASSGFPVFLALSGGHERVSVHRSELAAGALTWRPLTEAEPLTGFEYAHTGALTDDDGRISFLALRDLGGTAGDIVLLREGTKGSVRIALPRRDQRPLRGGVVVIRLRTGPAFLVWTAGTEQATQLHIVTPDGVLQSSRRLPRFIGHVLAQEHRVADAKRLPVLLQTRTDEHRVRESVAVLDLESLVLGPEVWHGFVPPLELLELHTGYAEITGNEVRGVLAFGYGFFFSAHVVDLHVPRPTTELEPSEEEQSHRDLVVRSSGDLSLWAFAEWAPRALALKDGKVALLSTVWGSDGDLATQSLRVLAAVWDGEKAIYRSMH